MDEGGRLRVSSVVDIVDDNAGSDVESGPAAIDVVDVGMDVDIVDDGVTVAMVEVDFLLGSS